MTPLRVFTLAWRTIWLHRLRSLLTVLGIVLGVGSVVAMLAIVEGASQDAQARIRRMGSRNILLTSIAPPASENASSSRQRVLEYGLVHADVRRIRETVPGVVHVVPRRDLPEEVRFGPRKFTATIASTEPDYAAVNSLRLERGRFLSPADLRGRRAVCVLGSEVATRLFLNSDPLHRLIWAGPLAYRVVGVLSPRGDAPGGAIVDVDAGVFIPLSTMDERYGDVIRNFTSGTFSLQRVQLHRIVVEAASLEAVPAVAAALRALVARWHPDGDVRLTVPLELLRQARETKRTWTIVFSLIAAISLVVGGIGIMNIMLASVMERTREIGIRRAVGARRVHIVLHFLAEAVLLSVGGGLIGLLLGIAIPLLVSRTTGMPTVVTPFSLVVAFGISAGIGVVFGIYPAERAARLDPVEALRHE
ncbi:MAG: ABC transporter permease [Planctomycetota bacterium]